MPQRTALQAASSKADILEAPAATQLLQPPADSKNWRRRPPVRGQHHCQSGTALAKIDWCISKRLHRPNIVISEPQAPASCDSGLAIQQYHSIRGQHLNAYWHAWPQDAHPCTAAGAINGNERVPEASSLVAG